MTCSFIPISWLAVVFASRAALAAVAIGLATISPEHPNSCLDDVTGQAHAVNTAWSLRDTCGQAACIQRQDVLYVTYESCGFAEAEPPCHIVYNTSATYPDCCGKVVCDSVEGNEIDVDEYGHYDEYMMSSYDSPHFIDPVDEKRQKMNSVENSKKPKLSQLQLVSQLPADHQESGLLTIILPNSYYSSADHSDAAGQGTSGSNNHHDDATLDYDMELPKPMKSATVFDYHEISIDDYDWDRIFGEAAALGSQ